LLAAEPFDRLHAAQPGYDKIAYGQIFHRHFAGRRLDERAVQITVASIIEEIVSPMGRLLAFFIERRMNCVPVRH
jgi:hypothetical protein